MLDRSNAGEAPRLAVVLKGYPRLSETFIAQEILELERRGFSIEIWSLRHPTDKAVHPMHRTIAAPRFYLPEYLHHAPLRVLKGFAAAWSRPEFSSLLRLFWRDLLRDFTRNRFRRLGQAMVMARELDKAIRHIHVHYLHTPCSVVRYAALLTDRTFSVSAHAKDIWTTPDWEKREKLADARFALTCTETGARALQALQPPTAEPVVLVYHGLDLSRFPDPPRRPAHDGRTDAATISLVTVGRCVGKKGFDDLLDALAKVPADLHWRLTHVGSGPLLKSLKAQVERLGLGARVRFLGSRPQEDVFAALTAADMFVLACREGEKGDRDGLPNVILEAAALGLPIVSTRFAGVPEFVREDEEGILVAPRAVEALAAAITALAHDPARRQRLGASASRRIREDFSFQGGVDRIEARLRAQRLTV